MDALAAVLNQYWGYDAFLPYQREAMDCVVEGRDSVVVLPTGGGKSLCFQAPALVRDGMGVVVSPLIALMKDQVDALKECGIPAASIHSMLGAEERRTVFEDLRAHRVKLLYVAPERLVTERFIDFLQELPLSFVAVDEAHCISMWGHDFRPEYRQLRVLRETFPGLAFHAYTATATEKVRADISRELALANPAFHVGPCDRPNLTYRVSRRGDMLRQVREVIDRHPKESGIVYCIRRKDVDTLCAKLRELGYGARPYHAGMADLHRKQNQEAFIREEEDIIVATIAFGMGIDKSNVRYVVHAAMPKSLEHYQQESGRAGRDGLEAECVLLFSGADFMLWRSIIGEDGEAAAIALKKLDHVYRYCTSVGCRHHAILDYFGQAGPGASCEACDICLDDYDGVEDSAAVAQTILRGIAGLEQRFGGAYVASVLAGARTERILQYRHDTLDVHGALKESGQASVRDWIEQMVGQGLIEKTGEYNVLELSSTGRALFRGDADAPAVRLLKPAVAAGKAPRKRSRGAAESWEGVDEELFEHLRELRRNLAREKSVPAYVVFGDASLRDMARLRPTARPNFLRVHGVGKAKAAEYGKIFVQTIRTYCEEKGLDTDVEGPPAAASREAAPPKAAPGQKKGPAAQQRAFALFEEGLSLDEVGSRLSRARSTTAGYLLNFIRESGRTSPEPWVSAADAERVRRVAGDLGAKQRLKTLRDALGGDVESDAISLTLACMENEGQEAAPGAAEPVERQAPDLEEPAYWEDTIEPWDL